MAGAKRMKPGWFDIALSGAIKAATGRQYRLTPGALKYALEKGGTAILRGGLWELVRLRSPTGLMLGSGTHVLSPAKLTLGKGVFIGAHSYIECDAENGVTLADGVTIREFAWIQCRSGLNQRGLELTVGLRSYIGPGAILGVGGPIKIGANVQIGGRVALSAESHLEVAGAFVGGDVGRRGITIGDRVWLGNNVTVLDGVTIGHSSVVGAGAVVTRDVPPGSVASGVPARSRPRAPISHPDGPS